MYSDVSVLSFMIYSTASKLKLLFFHKSDKYSVPSPAGFSVMPFFFFVFNSIHVEAMNVYSVKYVSNLISSPKLLSSYSNLIYLIILPNTFYYGKFVLSCVTLFKTL